MGSLKPWKFLNQPHQTHFSWRYFETAAHPLLTHGRQEFHTSTQSGLPKGKLG